MDTQQKVLDTPLPEQWQPQENELVWLNVARKDGKQSTFRVRVLSVEAERITVELFPEFDLAQPFTYTAKVSDVAPLD